MRWALCTKQSRMPSAMVGSPICSCQRETGIEDRRSAIRFSYFRGMGSGLFERRVLSMARLQFLSRAH
jgi:hypothetical protein